MQRFLLSPPVLAIDIGGNIGDYSAELRRVISNEPGSGLASLTQRNLEHRSIPFNATEQVRVIRFEDYWHQMTGLDFLCQGI
ncbi:MAG: hypothetical protein ACKOYJ_10210 [Planctomycetia bacterium]